MDWIFSGEKRRKEKCSGQFLFFAYNILYFCETKECNIRIFKSISKAKERTGGPLKNSAPAQCKQCSQSESQIQRRYLLNKPHSCRTRSGSSPRKPNSFLR